MTDHTPQGYPKLARLLSKAKDAAIFRRFDDLNILCLLSLQAEIVQLEKEYRIECYADDTSGDSQAKQFSSNFHLARGSNNTQMNKLREIRGLLREYNELLIQLYELGQIDKPLKSQLTNLRSWLDHNPFLSGYEATTWHESDRVRDYVSLEPLGHRNDPFTKFLLETGIWLFDRAVGRFIPSDSWLGGPEVIDEAQPGGVRAYTSDAVNRASNIITAVMASALPVMAIYVLNTIGSTEVRIGATVGFTVGFAVLMGIFSSAKRSEIIAATATFAAIEVVFIGTTLSAGDAKDNGGNMGMNNTTTTGG